MAKEEIEVEIKVPLEGDFRERLLAGAVLVRRVELRDVYFDDASFSLTLADKWLRERNGKFELKQPPEGGSRIGETAVQRYVEVSCDGEILSALGLLEGDDMAEVLRRAGIKPFAVIKSVRQKFKRKKFAIDIDETEFGYSLAEVELMAKDEQGVEEAQKEIMAFLAECGIGDVKRQLGKVAVYLRENSPEHFKKLVMRGVISV